jgi:uncharacterized repeat protein (TIGR02543 family)
MSNSNFCNAFSNGGFQMGNVPSSVILTVAGIVAAATVVSFGYVFVSSQQSQNNVSNEKAASVDAAINEDRYTQYDGKEIRGSDVVAALEYMSHDNVSVAVEVQHAGSTSLEQFVNVYDENTGKLTKISENDNNQKMADAKQQTSDIYIQPTDLYTGTVIRNKANNEIMQVRFVLSGSSAYEYHDSGDHGSDVPVVSNTYTITYDPNGGSGSQDVKIVDFGTATTIRANGFQREGYQFIGWSTDKSAANADSQYAPGVNYNPSTNPKNITLYAIYKAEQYTITYDVNGGLFSDSKTQHMQGKAYGVDQTILNDIPTRTGYVFLGWSPDRNATNATYTTSPSNNTIKDNANVLLYAVWTRQKTFVTFNANGGSGKMETQTFNNGVPSYLNNNAFTKDGYSFAGWAVSASGDKAYADNQNITFKGTEAGLKQNGTNYDLTLYAVWTKEAAYKLTYELAADDATWAPADETPKLTKVSNGVYQSTTEVNGLVALNSVAPVRQGYTFDGWVQGALKDGGNSTLYYPAGGQVNIDKDHATYHAHWTIASNNYTVRYYMQKPDGTWDDTPDHANDSAVIGNKVNVYIEDFDGYELDTNKTKFSGDSKTDSGALYHTIILDDNAYKNQYTVEKDKNGENEYIISLYYKTKSYAVTFFAQKGVTVQGIKINGNSQAGTATDGHALTIQAPYDSTISFKAVVDEKNGYVFGGWSDAVEDTFKMSLERPYRGAKNSDNNEEDIRVHEAQSFTATAMKGEYNISYNLNGGLQPVGSQPVNHPEVYKAAANGKYELNPNSYYSTDAWKISEPSKTGYVFVGWESASPIATWNAVKDKDGNIKSFTIPKGTTEVLQFEAVWETETPYAITYTYHDDTNNKDFDKTIVKVSGNPDTYTIENSFTLVNPEVAGYTFTGWTASGAMTKPATQQMLVPAGTHGALNFTAHFTTRTDCITYFSAGDGIKVTPDKVTGAYNASVQDLIKKNNSGNSLPTTAKTGYTVSKWIDADGNVLDASSRMKSEPVTYTAVWTANNYIVQFNANGGSGTMAKQSMTYDAPAALTGNSFTRTGYTFAGWATSNADNAPVTYADKQFVENLTTTQNGAVNLYAVWKKNDYSITYDLDGGTPSGNMPTSAAFDTEFTVKNPVKQGYIFEGWDIAADGGAAQHHAANAKGFDTFKNLSSKVNSSVTMKAKWTTKGTSTTYTVQYMLEQLDKNVGTNNATFLLADSEVKVGETGQNTAEVTRKYAGYDLQQPTAEQIKADGTTVLTVKYKLHKYTLTLQPDKNSSKGIASTGFSGPFSGSTSGTNVSTKAVYYGETVSLNAVAADGYTFGGYKVSNAELPSNSFVMPAADTTIEAFVKDPNGTEYSITYVNMQDGTNKWNNPTKAQLKTTIGPMYREGYHVSSYDNLTNESGTIAKTQLDGAKIDINNVKGNLQIQVNWEPNQYTIQYNSSFDGSSKKVSGYIYGINDALEGAETFKRNNYELIGWTFDETYAKTPVTTNIFTTDPTKTAANGYFQVGQTKDIGKIAKYYKNVKNINVYDWDYTPSGGPSATGYTKSDDKTIQLYAIWKALPVRVQVVDLFVTADYLKYQSAMHTTGTVHASTGAVLGTENYSFRVDTTVNAEDLAGKQDHGYSGDGVNNTVKTVTSMDNVKNKYGSDYEYIGSDTQKVSGNGDTLIYRYYKARVKTQAVLPDGKYALAGKVSNTENVSYDVDYALNAENQASYTNRISTGASGTEGYVFNGQIVTIKNIRNSNPKYTYGMTGKSRVTAGTTADPTASGFIQATLPNADNTYSLTIEHPEIISVTYEWARYHILYQANGGTMQKPNHNTEYDQYVAYTQSTDYKFAHPDSSTDVGGSKYYGFTETVDMRLTRSGYTFAGWNTKADGTGESFHDGDNLTKDLIHPGDAGWPDIKLYAQWTKTQDGLKIDGNNKVTNNNSWNAWVIVRVSVPMNNSKTELVTYTIPDTYQELGKKEEADGHTMVHYYGYKTALRGGETTSDPWYTASSVNETVKNAVTETYTSVGVQAFAVNAGNSQADAYKLISMQ